MKKVVALLGTKRKVNTYKLLLNIRNLLTEHNIELEIIEHYKYDMNDCVGSLNELIGLEVQKS